KAAEAFAPSESFVSVANPLSAKFDTMRPSLLPGLVDAVAHNRRHGRKDVALFEIGARFTKADGERRALGLAWTGAPSEHWSSPARDVDFYDVKGVLENLGEAIGHALSFEPGSAPFLVPGQAASVLSGGVAVGVAGQ